MATDQHYMKIALELAKQALGTTAPNPSVGCVIVKNDQIVAKAVTAKGGRPHAETQAINIAGKDSIGATAYVTLEPCCHHGQTGPCTEAIINSGISKVVIANQDISPKIASKGIAALQKNGVEVVVGVGEEEASKINAGFFCATQRNRPLVTLKLATTLDGKIALANGKSKWVTNQQSRNYAHQLRASHDAIMVGVGTVIADDPELTCRIDGLDDRSPIRVIIDSNGKTPANSNLISTADTTPTWIVTSNPNHPLSNSDINIINTNKNDDGQVDLKLALMNLAENGITRLLVEGGSKIATSLLKEKLIDQLVWISAPKIFGNDALPAINNLDLSSITKELVQTDQFFLEEDCIRVFDIL